MLDEKKPDLYLALELEPGAPEHIHDLPDEMLFATNLAGLLTHDAVNGERWVRGWRAFTDREAALAHQAAGLVVVLIPLMADAIPAHLID